MKLENLFKQFVFSLSLIFFKGKRNKNTCLKFELLLYGLSLKTAHTSLLQVGFSRIFPIRLAPKWLGLFPLTLLSPRKGAV